MNSAITACACAVTLMCPCGGHATQTNSHSPTERCLGRLSISPRSGWGRTCAHACECARARTLSCGVCGASTHGAQGELALRCLARAVRNIRRALARAPLTCNALRARTVSN
eukprot:306207-Alexandrium_andersonii.AAC.1